MTQQCYTAYPGPLSAPSCAQASIVLNHDPENVINWGLTTGLSPSIKRRLILLSLSRSKSPHISTLATLQELADIRLLGLSFTSNLSWDKYIRSIAKRASQRVGCLYRARQYLPPTVSLCSTFTSPQYVLPYYLCWCCSLSLVPAWRYTATCCRFSWTWLGISLSFAL